MKHKATDPVPNLTYGLRNLEEVARRHNHGIRSLTTWLGHSLLLEELQNCNEKKPSKVKRIKPGEMETLSMQTFMVSLTRTTWTEAIATLEELDRSQGAVDLALGRLRRAQITQGQGQG